MRTVKLTLEYEGTAYHGWQKQPERLTVQALVEEAVRRVTGETNYIHGASRTDAGVHALCQTASFDTMCRVPAPAFAPAVNSFLPGDVVVVRAEEMAPGFNAQFDAQWKHYRYLILNSIVPSAIKRNLCWRLSKPLDVDRMRNAAQTFVGTRDFTAVAARSDDRKSPVRTVHRVSVGVDSPWLTVDAWGGGFLYKMVRLMTGALVEVGKGNLTRVELENLLLEKKRGDRFPAAPACGLCLMQVSYDEWSGV